MLLTRELLDMQLIDRRGNRMGRVDGIVLELRAGQLPKVAFIETGGDAPWRRLGHRLAGWARAILNLLPGRDEPTRIPWPAVLNIDADVHVSMDAAETPVMALELWLREHFMRHMPWT
jgi:sporulation protein YlmC with PRC-barrel domain